MVAPSADVGLADHQSHPTAAQDQDTSQPLTAAHRENPIPTSCQPPQAKPKQQRYPKRTPKQQPKRSKVNLFQTDKPLSLKHQRADRLQKPKSQTIDTRMIAAYLLEASQIKTDILTSYIIGKQLDPNHQLTPQQKTLLQLPNIPLPFVTSLQHQTSDSLASERSWPEHDREQESPVTELDSETSSSSQLSREPSQPLSDSLGIDILWPEPHEPHQANAPTSSSQPLRESWQTLEDLLAHYPEDLSTEARATFSNTIVPLLQEQWPFIAPEWNKTILDYFAHGGALYPQVLQDCPASEWVSQSILQDLSQEALATNNPILRDRFLSAMLPLEQSQPAPVFTQFLLALQKKQQQCNLHLNALCQILEYLPPHAEGEC